MRIKANSMRFGVLMWSNTRGDKGSSYWRKDAKRFARRKDRAISKMLIREG